MSTRIGPENLTIKSSEYLSRKREIELFGCLIGPTGIPGLDGTAVNTGATGNSGPTGFTGPTGLPGSAVNTGATGTIKNPFPDVLILNNGTESTTTQNGTLIVYGGVGITGNTNIGGLLSVNGVYQYFDSINKIYAIGHI